MLDFKSLFLQYLRFCVLILSADAVVLGSIHFKREH